jgi:amidase
MGFADYDCFDALGLAELVAKGAVTALELVDTAIARIEALNPRLNAVIFTDFDGARERAKGRLPDGPFKGVPFLLKDILGDLAGWPTRNGSRLSPPAPMPFTATLVQRFLAGGLVPLGKTNVPEFGLVATTESSSMARRAIRGTRSIRPAVRRAVRVPRWRAGWCPSPTPTTAAARSAFRRAATGSSG